MQEDGQAEPSDPLLSNRKARPPFAQECTRSAPRAGGHAFEEASRLDPDPRFDAAFLQQRPEHVSGRAPDGRGRCAGSRNRVSNPRDVPTLNLDLVEEEVYMETFRRALVVAGFLAIAAPGAHGQVAPLNPANAKPFLGVWVIEMTEPPEFKGTQTIRVWDNSGTVAASIQTNPKFPAIERPASTEMATCWS